MSFQEIGSRHYKDFLEEYTVCTYASDDLRISTSHETNGQAYLGRVPAFAREFVLSEPLCVLCSLSTK